MNRYENGKIYKIVDIGYNKCYIGSTCESLSKRMERHRNKYKSYLKGTVEHTRSFYLFDEYDIENCKIELVENYPCISKSELLAREGHHIRNSDCVNKKIAGRSGKQYYEENKEHCLKRQKEYREQHKEQTASTLKKYAEEHKEEIKTYKKQYREENKEKVKQQLKEWYEKNREAVLQKKQRKKQQDLYLWMRVSL